MSLPLLALSAAACGSVDTPAGPSEGPADLATAAALPSFLQIAIGGNHTCALTGGGLIYCWGYNFFGQLGDGTTQNRLKPVPVQGGALRFRRVTAGSWHTCAETTEGKAYCWGNNNWGQLGIGTSGAGRLTPVPVFGGRTFSLVEAGFQHTCAVTVRDAYCWGDNQFGQLGEPASTGFTRNVPVLVAGGLAFKWVAPGAKHTCGLTTASRVFCWGNNSFGQLGDGTSAYHLVPGPVAGSRLYKYVRAGSLHSCALGMDDKAYCWGDNSSGEIGDGTTTRRLVPRAVSGGRRYQGLSAGSSQNCATDLAKHSWCWGSNAFGALGDGTTTTRLVPVATRGSLEFVRLKAGVHSCGVTAGGQAYCWGYNGFGEIGDGTRINRLRPRLVGGS
jgi:alpha-tubulin suppressor-like RCC1 family protein